jgi:hypothetical protein
MPNEGDRMAVPDYPWYAAVQSTALEQGDVFEGCPVFVPPTDLADGALDATTFEWDERDLIILTQSCDLAEGREKVEDVLLCAVWRRSELTEGHLASAKGMEDGRRGNLPGYHVLAGCELPGLEREVRVVDFRRVYSLPLAFVRRRAASAGDRMRLLPPYREHLSQAFARFFMRVGLPVDVPPFK